MVSLDNSGHFVFRLLDSTDNQHLLSSTAFPAKGHRPRPLEVKWASKELEVSAAAQYLAP
jgi:hypothetical protein